MRAWFSTKKDSHLWEKSPFDSQERKRHIKLRKSGCLRCKVFQRRWNDDKIKFLGGQVKRGVGGGGGSKRGSTGDPPWKFYCRPKAQEKQRFGKSHFYCRRFFPGNTVTLILDNYPPSTLQGVGLGGRKNPRVIVRAGFRQNGFFADFYFWAAGLFRGCFSPDFFSSFLWEKVPRKNPPGKSPGKSSKFYTTKILQHISADWPGQLLSERIVVVSAPPLSRKCAINNFWTKKFARLLGWGSRGSRQIIYVRIFPQCLKCFRDCPPS